MRKRNHYSLERNIVGYFSQCRGLSEAWRLKICTYHDDWRVAPLRRLWSYHLTSRMRMLRLFFREVLEWRCGWAGHLSRRGAWQLLLLLLRYYFWLALVSCVSKVVGVPAGIVCTQSGRQVEVVSWLTNMWLLGSAKKINYIYDIVWVQLAPRTQGQF